MFLHVVAWLFYNSKREIKCSFSLVVAEKELQRLQEKKRKPLSSKDMIKTLQEAKDSHMKQLMDSTEQSEAFLTDDGERNEISCCFPLYRAIFPKQPLTNEELECLVQEESDKNNDGSVTYELKT